jgi:hypothetical protein
MIAVECFADITLVQSLNSVPREHIAHFFRGRSGVCKYLSATGNSKGMIDEDPSAARHPYEEKGEVDNSFLSLDIKQLKYPSQTNELIVLCPKLEDWIIKSAQISHIELIRHGLPDDPNQLHNIIDQKINEFRTIIHLLKKEDSNRINTLARLLQVPV